MMDVYLVPTGPERYELYCESAEESAVPHVEASSGLWRRLHEAFSAVIAAAEREQDRFRAGDAASAERGGFWSRLRARSLRWVSERVAEQRLLWRLRGRQRVRAFVPSGIDDTRALAIIRGNLRVDLDRHRRWLALDAIGLLFSLPLAVLPGLNLPGYYFTFRVIGHFLAIRGARQGLDCVEWELQSNALLAELAGLERLPAAERTPRVRAIADQLGLARLARFFERTAVETA